MSAVETPLHGVSRAAKRALDVVVAVVVLAIVAPLLLLIAAGVKLSSPGPVLQPVRRRALDGREVLTYRFRTMTDCGEHAQIAYLERPRPRVTALGALLRRTSLDGLPQLLNVLEGTMSIVGPRALRAAQYRQLIGRRLLCPAVRPGITGWAQVNGLRGESATLHKLEQRIQHDLDYLRHWSLALDLRIILRALGAAFRRRSAY